MNTNERQTIIDAEHLDLLGLFHYITGGLTIAFSGVFIFQLLIMRLIMRTAKFHDATQQADAAIVQSVLGFAQGLIVFLMIAAVVYGALQIASGWCLRARKHWLFSFIVAMPALVMFPWGTLLGVFTMVVLERASVQELYRNHALSSGGG